MKFRNLQNIVILIPVLALLGAVIILKSNSHSNRIDYTTEDFYESDKALQNPYCGFYHIIGYTLSDEYMPHDGPDYEISSYTEPLALLEINLKNYRAAEISEKGLSQLNDILAAWAKSPNGTRLILRFLYDCDGIALATEPEKLELILKHMEQVSQSVNEYRDTVYIMQGVFIGNWGEMHHSKYSDLNTVKLLLDRLNELIDASIFLSVRTPSLWRAATNLYEPPEKFPSLGETDSLYARLGLFNDGILGSDSDLGTYGDTLKKDAVLPSYQGTRKEELEFQNKLCRYVPNGGEVVYNNNLSELETAVSALKAMHISYLNADYDSRVLEKWKGSVWKGNDVFNGCDGYSYIKAHLGYRYVIESCKIKKSGWIRTNYTLKLTVKNVGFSNTLMPFDASVTLLNEETGDCTYVPVNADFKSIESGNKKTFTAKLPAKGLAQGSYRIYFSVKDKASGQTVFLGNKNEITKNGYLLGRLEK